MNCEYCGRAESAAKTCEGCGAPSNHVMPAVMYDPRVFSKEDVKLLGRPRVNIPITLSSMTGYHIERVSDMVHQFYERNS